MSHVVGITTSNSLGKKSCSGIKLSLSENTLSVKVNQENTKIKVEENKISTTLITQTIKVRVIRCV